MTARAFAFVLALGLPLATGALAAVVASRSPDQTANVRLSNPPAASAPLPVKWVPAWLMEPLRRAIADATDTRPRK